ncbi:MAG TPA: glycogen synthase GlgA [Stellaceae bacterium]|jgi:starch synthase|nr:glycogen synthase GlgA [Stellaceae bacterium]
MVSSADSSSCSWMPISLSNRIRALFVSSEIYPIAKTGGLADVSAALPRELSRDGDIDLILMMPGYDSAFEVISDLRELCQLEGLPGGSARLLIGTMPETDLRVVILDQPQSFRRAGGLYVDQNGIEWPDNAIRFAAFCHAAAELAMGRVMPGWRADIVHCNDWHTGLVPVLLHFQQGRRPRTIMTLHNLAFQGNYPADLLPALNLPVGAFSIEGCEYFGQISFLKGAIALADKLTTVSPSYAEEITTPEFGMGMEGVLAHRRADLHGILNGIDGTIWNPETDPDIAQRYSADTLAGRAACKLAVQREWGLVPDVQAPLFVYAARIETQKMADVLLDVMHDLMERERLQVAILGKGARSLELGFAGWPGRAPGRVAVRIGYNEVWAHQLLAGGDILLHGARFEPCGLTPLYAMHYGAVPIVRAVGGLRDSVTDADETALADGSATGFQFAAANAVGLLDAVDRALKLYARPDLWHRLQRAGMCRDFSWRGSAARYRRIYDELLGLPA